MHPHLRPRTRTNTDNRKCDKKYSSGHHGPQHTATQHSAHPAVCAGAHPRRGRQFHSCSRHFRLISFPARRWPGPPRSPRRGAPRSLLSRPALLRRPRSLGTCGGSTSSLQQRSSPSTSLATSHQQPVPVQRSSEALSHPPDVLPLISCWARGPTTASSHHSCSQLTCPRPYLSQLTSPGSFVLAHSLCTADHPPALHSAPFSQNIKYIAVPSLSLGIPQASMSSRSYRTQIHKFHRRTACSLVSYPGHNYE